MLYKRIEKDYQQGHYQGTDPQVGRALQQGDDDGQEGTTIGVRFSAGNDAIVNRSAIGTQVRVKLDDRTLTRQVEAGTGEGNQNDLVLHFGLGTRVAPVDLEIAWPNGSIQSAVAVNVDQLMEYRFGAAPR